MSYILLFAVAALLAWFMWTDRSEYVAFKALVRTEDRQRVLRRWTLRSFLAFLVSALIVLALLGRLDALTRMPSEFLPLSERLGELLFGHGSKNVGSGFVLGIGAAILGGGVVGSFVSALLARRNASRPAHKADIEPILPRNRDERKWTALLGANAGPSEELFFRLMLPLLLAATTGNVLLAFALAAALFALLHLYQGWIGVAATGLAGLLFTVVYLATGNIWIASLLHSLINLNTLWLRPLLFQRSGG
jgi:membrane protease YdiL (CAAX protease family)